MGELWEGRADVCASGLGLTLELMEAADFYFALMPTMLTITARNPFWEEQVRCRFK